MSNSRRAAATSWRRRPSLDAASEPRLREEYRGDSNVLIEPRVRALREAASCVLIPVSFWFLRAALDPRAQSASAITLFMILSRATELLGHGLTGLIGCYLFWALNVVGFEVAFSGFANDTPWFL